MPPQSLPGVSTPAPGIGALKRKGFPSPIVFLRASPDFLRNRRIIAYTEPECLHGAEMDAACGRDILMGTVYSDAVHAYCRAHGLRYMPFVGQISGRPSILHGTPAGMICEAEGYLAKGVDGIDLLGYRYTGDAAALNRAFIAAVHAPICLAGSVNSFARLDEIKAAGAAYFTIGSAFFAHAFGGDIADQINTVCDYMEAPYA